jgi:hypothetical protein
VKQWIAVLLPRIKDEIVDEIRQDIAKEINEIPVARFRDFPIPEFVISTRQRRKITISAISVEDSSRYFQHQTKFLGFVGQVRASISAHVKDFELVKFQQHLEYIKEEHKQEKAKIR